MSRSSSVDFFRGLTIALMIVVNTPGTWESVYGPLRHAQWHGCTPTDLVFPSFMFIIGVSMWFSFEKYGRKLNADMTKKILKRTAILFFIGLILNNFPFLWKNWDTWRILGVPQRLALGYCFAAFLCLSLSRKWLIYTSTFLLFLYWGLLNWFAIDPANPYALGSNAVLRLDTWLFGEKHLYHGDGIGFDPEGLLSTIPSIVTVILGWLSGEVMNYRQKQTDLMVRDLLFLGIICGFVGLAWDLFFPINKKLWTSSYVLYAGGISIIVLATCTYIIDKINWRNGTGLFFAFGANSLFAYIFSEALIMLMNAIKVTNAAGAKISSSAWIYETVFKPLGSPEFGSLLFALTYMALCWLVCRYLYVRNIFIKI
jgi:predicted acyltransferase